MKQMNERFLIQRYSGGNWPQIRGDVPFLATGPWFKTWAYGLDKFGEWRFGGDLGGQFEEAYSSVGTGLDQRYYAAWALLECGFVEALWVGHSDVSAEDRWEVSVNHLASEIPKGPLGESVLEYLSGLADPGHFRSYVSEDQIELVPLACPTS